VVVGGVVVVVVEVVEVVVGGVVVVVVEVVEVVEVVVGGVVVVVVVGGVEPSKVTPRAASTSPIGLPTVIAPGEEKSDRIVAAGGHDE
jgi:hypothetical protein